MALRRQAPARMRRNLRQQFEQQYDPSQRHGPGDIAGPSSSNSRADPLRPIPGCVESLCQRLDGGFRKHADPCTG